jgi:hypothetical protein
MHGVVYYLDSTVITVGNDLMELAAQSLILLLLPHFLLFLSTPDLCLIKATTCV